MKALFCAVFCFAALASAETLSELVAKIKERKLAALGEFKDVRVVNWSDDGTVSIVHSAGVAKVPLASLPDDLRIEIIGVRAQKEATDDARRAASLSAFHSDQVQKTSSEVAPPVINGASPPDVYLALKAQGFSEDMRPGKIINEWHCYLDEPMMQYEAEIIGPSGAVSKLCSVTATVTDANKRPDVENTGGFLGLIASMPYEGAKPAESAKWVRSKIAARVNASIVVGGVRFDLYFNSRRSTLVLTAAP